jgi:hypothetical protein
MREMTRADLDGQICYRQESMPHTLACGLAGVKFYPTNQPTFDDGEELRKSYS